MTNDHYPVCSQQRCPAMAGRIRMGTHLFKNATGEKVAQDANDILLEHRLQPSSNHTGNRFTGFQHHISNEPVADGNTYLAAV